MMVVEVLLLSSALFFRFLAENVRILLLIVLKSSMFSVQPSPKAGA